MPLFSSVSPVRAASQPESLTANHIEQAVLTAGHTIEATAWPRVDPVRISL
jgi:hypothetical protein